MSRVVPRLAAVELAASLEAHRAVLLVGPRACGKTTLASGLARASVRLDAPSDSGAFRADPDAALGAITQRPLLLDEWQEVPGVMGAIKRAVDAGAPRGSFILTGSVRAEADGSSWPGTGRVIDVPLAPLTVREIACATGPGFIARVLAGSSVAAPVADAPDVVGYVDLALRGGFPEPALELEGDARQRWYRTYADRLADRDVIALLGRADPVRARRFLTAYALNSAGVVDLGTLLRATGVRRETGMRYEAALQRLFAIRSVPAWGTNRLHRLGKTPKRFVVDAAVMAAAAGASRDAVLRDGALLGRILETLVFAQVQPELDALGLGHALFHLRDANGRREVDFIIELEPGRVFGVEVKASATATAGDARHLAWLRDELGDHFVGGVVLHTGPYAFPLGDRLSALPIAALWAG